MWTDRTGRLLAALVLGFHGADILLVGRANFWALGFRVLWALALFVYAPLSRGASRGRVRLLTDAMAVVTCLCVLGISAATGGVRSPYIVLVPVLPLAVSLMFREDQRASLLSGGVGSVGILALLWGSGSRAAEAMVWSSVVMGITLFAGYLAHHMRREQSSEQQLHLERARRESLEALTLSEHRRAQAEKLAIVGRLASGVAHELSNPLAYVGSNVSFVEEELRSPEEMNREELIEVLGQTRVGLQHMRQIVADLKGFARMDGHEPAACAVAEVVADAVKLASLRLKHVAEVRVDVPADLPEVFVVRQRLVQVLLNLLVNAGDALDAQKVRGGEVRVLGRCEEGRVVVLIEDNGPGFAPNVLPRLFEAFFTTKGPEKGTGLGLNLSRELVQQFGGSLTAGNRPEGGACMRLELAAHSADSRQSAA